MCEFHNFDGSKTRPYSRCEEVDAIMIQNWNKVVQSGDKVYHLGDVCFDNKTLHSVMPRLNGTKVLIRGNHDRLKLSAYAQYFKDIRGCHNLDNYLLTHVPIHPWSMMRFKGNIHGHTHGNNVIKRNPKYIPGDISTPEFIQDYNYYNACVEVNSYAPISFEDVKKWFTEDSWEER